jgi:flagellar biosynthesis protein FliR
MMQNQAAPPHVGSALLTLVALILTVLAVIRSPRKWHTALYIMGCVIIGGLLGTVLGLAISSPEGAGALAGVGMQFAGIAAAIERIRRYRKTIRLGK